MFEDTWLDESWLDEYALSLGKIKPVWFAPVAKRKVVTVKSELVLELLGESWYNERIRTEGES
jgi:hypothetical protein